MRHTAETYRRLSAQQQQPMMLDVAHVKKIAVHLIDIICSRGEDMHHSHLAKLRANLSETPGCCFGCLSI